MENAKNINKTTTKTHNNNSVSYYKTFYFTSLQTFILLKNKYVLQNYQIQLCYGIKWRLYSALCKD